MSRTWLLVGAGVLCGIGIAGTVWLVRKRFLPGMNPQYQLRDDILVHGNQSLKEVALTFDDGPHPETMRVVLNELGKQRIRATFFLVGSQMRKYPAIVRRIIDEGHEVGNHTQNHPRLDALSEEEIRKEMEDCERSFHAATGSYMHLFRPPGMRYDDTVIDIAQSLGYVTIHWNSAAQDYEPKDPEVICKKVLDSTSPGSVILLHDHPDTVRALPKILGTLKDRGYRFVTISQMLGRLNRPVFAKSNAYTCKPFVAEKVVGLPQNAKSKPKNVAKPKLGLKSNATPNIEDRQIPNGRGVDVPVGGG